MSEGIILGITLVIGIGITVVLITTLVRAINRERRSAGAHTDLAQLRTVDLLPRAVPRQLDRPGGRRVGHVRPGGAGARRYAEGLGLLRPVRSVHLRELAVGVPSALLVRRVRRDLDPPRERGVEGRGGPHRADREEDRETPGRGRDRIVRVLVVGSLTPTSLAPSRRVESDVSGYERHARARAGGDQRTMDIGSARKEVHPEEQPESEHLLAVLDEAVVALRGADITFLLMGGLATSVLGRGRGVTDIDLFVRDRDVGSALSALRDSGFETLVVSPNWLAKGFKDDVLVDVISRSTHDITLTDEILERAIEVDVHGRRLPCVSPEDLIVMKAVATTEDTGRYWYDALSLLGRPDLDWAYLARRAKQHGAKRLISFLFFAQSMDLLVPDEIVEDLIEAVRPVASRAGD
jgi:predicted nucleotidyltransferase